MLRSGHCCEYCKSQDKFSPVFFTIDHIIPPLQGGTHDVENLAYSCPLCNRLKWQKVHGVDPVTKNPVRIFNPRLDRWQDHFQWSEDYLQIIGITAIGRATVDVLRLNREKLITYRREMFEIGQHPPK
ncbi:MAG TPA: HNH endonuclease signature motif containing protein [Saprospiraceae bacterium]|nr:HNH endonuclease signature motif containing protein [Saprospiraceae bacterium]